MPLSSKLIRMRHIRVAAILAMIAVSGRAAERVIDNFMTPQTWFRALTVPASELSQRKAEGLATRFLNAAAGRTLIVFRVFAEGPDLDRRAAFLTDVDPFKIWRDQYDRMVSYTRPVAHVAYIAGDAVLQYRDGRGKENRKVLKGSDPLLFSRDGTHFEIIGVQRQGRASNADFRLLVRTDSAVNQQAAAHLTEEFHARLGVPMLTLVFRTDCWFADEMFYPTFAGCGAPPSEDQYRRSPVLRCAWVRAKVNCVMR